MVAPSDLTGRDLDLAVARALGFIWYAGRDHDDQPGVTYLRPGEFPPSGWHRIDEPGPRWGSPWLPGYDCDGGRIPELFAEIAARGGIEVALIQYPKVFEACCGVRGSTGSTLELTVNGSTPNEALARLLLMVAQPVL